MVDLHSRSAPLIGTLLTVISFGRISLSDWGRRMPPRGSLQYILTLMISVLALSSVGLWVMQPNGWLNGLISIGVASSIYLLALLLLQHLRAHWLGTMLIVAGAALAVWLNIFSYQDEYPVGALLWVAMPIWFAIILEGYRSGLLTAAVTVAMVLYYHSHATGLLSHLGDAGTASIVLPADSFIVSFGIFLGCATVILAVVDYGRSRSQNQLILSEQKQRLYVAQTNMALIECRSDGVITAWNAAAERMFGYRAAEVIGQKLATLLMVGEERTEMGQIFQALRNGQTAELRTVNTNLGKDDRKIICSWAVTGIRTEHGHFLGFVCSAIDITQERQRAQELQQAKEAAEAAAHAKSAFLANMSHEIRTPMNGIMGLTDLLLATPLDPQQSEYVDHVQTSAAALLSIINEVLDFSKLESGKVALEQQQFDLHQCIHDVLMLFEHRETCDTVALTATIHNRVPVMVKGDAGRLRQILLNLVGNAVKFTAEGEIRLIVDSKMTSANQIELYCKVQDTGIGIRAEQLPQLFESFTQADVSTTRKYGGTGLGLAISKLLVERMGGTIWVESRLNQGSSFHFTLPLQRGLPCHKPKQQQHRNVLQSAKALLQNAGADAALAILLVEDNPVNQKVTMRTFEYFGYTVDLAQNGVEAVAAVQQRTYDVIFMDIQMPQMDGLEATRRIRRLGGPAIPLPIVAMTAAVLEDERQQALAAGIDDVINKPVRPDELARKLIAIHHARHRLLPALS